MTYAFGDDYVPIGGFTDVRFEITTKPGATYYPMDVELILPFQNDTAVYTVCRAEVLHAGRNLPCFNASAVNESMAYTSKYAKWSTGLNIHFTVLITIPSDKK